LAKRAKGRAAAVVSEAPANAKVAAVVVSEAPANAKVVAVVSEAPASVRAAVANAAASAGPTSRMTALPRKCFASTVRPRWSRAAADLAGDKKGRVGMGQGKANQVADCIRKASENARTQLVSVVLRDTTIPHEILSRYDGAKVLLRPASNGTGIIAGKTVRAVCELAGIRNMLSKSLGSNNPLNLAKATLHGLLELRDRNEVMKARGKSVPEPEAPAAEETPAAEEPVATEEPAVAAE